MKLPKFDPKPLERAWVPAQELVSTREIAVRQVALCDGGHTAHFKFPGVCRRDHTSMGSCPPAPHGRRRRHVQSRWTPLRFRAGAPGQLTWRSVAPAAAGAVAAPGQALGDQFRPRSGRRARSRDALRPYRPSFRPPLPRLNVHADRRRHGFRRSPGPTKQVMHCRRARRAAQPTRVASPWFLG